MLASNRTPKFSEFVRLFYSMYTTSKYVPIFKYSSKNKKVIVLSKTLREFVECLHFKKNVKEIKNIPVFIFCSKFQKMF